jgi:hypothetical protein
MSSMDRESVRMDGNMQFHPFPKRKSAVVRAKVRRSACGEAYIRTSRSSADADSSERVFVSEGASMLFWRDRTYRLFW